MLLLAMRDGAGADASASAAAAAPAVRRARNLYSEEEVQHLQRGVEKHGAGNWDRILADNELSFHASRGAASLKHKWQYMMKMKMKVKVKAKAVSDANK